MDILRLPGHLVPEQRNWNVSQYVRMQPCQIQVMFAQVDDTTARA